VVEDLDAHWVFVNLQREPRFAAMRPETVRSHVLRLRRELTSKRRYRGEGDGGRVVEW
jgi:hypothetical protein